jgi:thioredoxin 1
MTEFIELSDTNFKEQIAQSTLPSVLFVHADWAGPSRSAKTQLIKASQGFRDKLNFFEIDVDNSPQFATEFDISAVPNLIIFEGAKEPLFEMGGKTEHEYRVFLERYLAEISYR